MLQNLQTKTSTTKETKKNKLLANPDVRRWYENVSRGSQNTAEVWLRRLSRFCDVHAMTPTELAELGIKDIKTLTHLLEDHITFMEDGNNSPGYISVTVTALKSWLEYHDVKITRKLKIRNKNATPTLENERVPESQELAELFNRAEMRTGAIMALMSKSGLRPEVLGNIDATDGLRIKDLPDLAIIEGMATFIRKPARIVVRSELSKARHRYFTFITDEGGKKLLAYLNDRILSGESLGPDEPVISPDKKRHYGRGANANKKFLPSRKISNLIRRAMRPRFKWRPYVLRAFFDTQLLVAESRGKIAHDIRAFFMGHKGNIEAVYTTNKGILSKTLLAEMTESFRRSEELLDIERSQEDPIEKQKEEMKSKIESMTSEQLTRMLELINNGKNSGSLESMRSNSSSVTGGNTSGLCQTEKSSSKKVTRTLCESGSSGIRTHDSRIKSPVLYLAEP